MRPQDATTNLDHPYQQGNYLMVLMEGIVQMKRLNNIKRSAHFAVSLTAIIGITAAASAQQVDIIPFGATWDYLFTAIDDGTGALTPADPFTANNVSFSDWTSLGFQTTTLTFDDGRSAPWQTGPAPFFIDESSITNGTELPLPDGDHRITQYFRHEFTAGQDFKNLTMSINMKDGAVVHLDGTPLSSLNSCCRDSSNRRYDVADPNDSRFGQAPGYRDTATFNIPGLIGTTYTERLTLETLSPGPHVISVEVHSSSMTDDDMLLDFRFFQDVDNEWIGSPDVQLDGFGGFGFFGGPWDEGVLWGAGFFPDGAGAKALLLGTPTRSTTIYSDRDVTLGRLELDNSNTYAIAGHGTFIFATADGSNAVIDVAQGDHEIQAKVALQDSVDISTVAGSSFRFQNDVNGNGNSINITGDGEALLNGAMVDVTVNAAAGAMSGGGSIGGDLINNGAVLSPGNEVGVLSVVGNFVQGSDGVLAIDLAGTGDYDLLEIRGTAEFGGTLEVSLLGDFQPSLGDDFDILDFSAATGSFDSMSLPALGDGLQWDMSNLYLGGSLAVVPEPTGILLLLCGTFAAEVALRLSTQRAPRNCRKS